MVTTVIWTSWGIKKLKISPITFESPCSAKHIVPKSLSNMIREVGNIRHNTADPQGKEVNSNIGFMAPRDLLK